MKGRFKSIFLISMILFTNISGMIIFTSAYARREEYQNAPQKIYERIESFSFYFGEGTIRYGVFIGVMFQEHNNTHKKLVSNAFVVTLNDYFVSSLKAYLDFDINFTSSHIQKNFSALRSDYSPFITSYEVIYAFNLFWFPVSHNLFPIRLHVDFEYHLYSSEFNNFGSLQATRTFDLFPLLGIALGIIIALGAIATIVTLIIFRVRKKNQRRRDYFNSVLKKDEKLI